MEDNPVLKKIAEAKAKFLYSYDQDVIENWQNQAKKHLFILSLKGNQGILIIIDSFKKDVSDLNDLLLTDRKLSENERIQLLDKRDMYKKFVQFFIDAESGIEKVEKEIDEHVV